MHIIEYNQKNMSKHSKPDINIGSVLLVAVLGAAVVAGAFKLVGGKTVNSEEEPIAVIAAQQDTPEEESSKNEQYTHNYAEQIQASQGKEESPEEPGGEIVASGEGGKMVFGQKPQSTENADPNEPDYVNTETPQEEQPAEVSGEDVTVETPEPPEGTEEPEAPAESAGNASLTSRVTDDWLVLANKTHHLSEDYWPDDMVTVSSCVEGVGNSDTRKMRKVAADALEELIKGAAEAGYQIKMRTGFRSYTYQASLFSSYAQRNGEAAANKYSARAGESEHQTGLCCDVSSPSVGWAISYDYGKTDEGKWLASHCHEYGFILRYLEGKEDVTGYVYEPWHIRYVGKDAAAEIFNKGICFEEYLGITD